MDGTQLAKMKEAIGKKDKATCVKLYDESLGVCYAGWSLSIRAKIGTNSCLSEILGG
jgi:hypothetical protein